MGTLGILESREARLRPFVRDGSLKLSEVFDRAGEAIDLRSLGSISPGSRDTRRGAGREARRSLDRTGVEVDGRGR